MKLTVETMKQSTLVKLNGPYNRVHINTKDLSPIETVIRIKLEKAVGKQTASLAGIRKQLLIKKEG